MLKIMSMQRPQLQDKLILLCAKPEHRNDRNALFALENYGGYNDHIFLAVFRLAEFFQRLFG